jgi:hypothetical protein
LVRVLIGRLHIGLDSMVGLSEDAEAAGRTDMDVITDI